MTIEQVTQSQLLLAQAFGSMAAATTNAATMEISTAGVLADTEVSSSVLAIQLYGKTTVGDGGDGIYVRGTGAGSISSGDGATWIPVAKTATQFTAVFSTFANLPAASSSAGMIRGVTDSTVNAWGAIIAGGGTHKVLAWSNGTNWTVIGV